MRLDRVQIVNFRSIQDAEIKFIPSCRVLVGINEAGKTNILKALALLNENLKPIKKNDLREPLPDENSIEESYVRFIFKFDKNESDKILETVSSKILANTNNPEIVIDITKQITLTLKDFCKTQDEGIYKANIINENKNFSVWQIVNNFNLSEGWKKPTKFCPHNFNIEKKGRIQSIFQYPLIRATDFAEIPENYLEEASFQDLADLIKNTITDIIKANLPKALFWQYDEDNLLPNSVKITDFLNNPNLCIPLENMFVLAGIENIKDSITEARKGSDNQFQNYLNRVAKKTTSHFREVWKEDYKDIEFSLMLNADQIIPGVKEKNTHDFSRRSDGFKRFITFLLMISVNVKTDKLRNTLLIIDEPDISLHPTGARYLRDELIRISKKNPVIYSTHSIFMIDSGDIDRHYVVKKKNEITSITSAGVSNIADEEVLYNALGHSVFAILKEKNIIFEGWKDKHLFKVFFENSPELRKKIKNVGICHAKGVKSIKAISPLIELANRKCLIISDCDKPAREYQKLYKQERGYGEWKTYKDIDSSIEALTGEDFLKNDYISKQVKFVLGSNLVFEKSILPEKKDKIAAIRKWLIDNGMSVEQIDDTLNQIKNLLFEQLTYQHIEDTYSKLAEGIVKQSLS